MSTTLKLVAGNTAPTWQITCERDGTVIDLTGCTVSLIIAKGNTITNASGAAVISSPATGGVITYSPLATDCPTAGSYKVDVKIVYSNATVEVLYEQLKIKTRKPIV